MSANRSAVVGFLLATAFSAAPALAQTEDFYHGKTVTIFVGFTPGGGYDAYARALAQFIPDHIPGHPTVIVQNLPGAGSLTAVRSIDVTQPKDGTVMATFNAGLITQSLVQPELANVDFRKYAWVGVVTPDYRVCYGYGPKGVSSWDDMMHRQQFVVGATAKGSGDYVNGATLRVIFGAPIKQVLGFPGSSELHIAIEQGELDGDCGSFSSIPPDWLSKSEAHLFVRFNADRPPEVPASAGFIDDFATTQDQKTLLDFLDAANDVGRPFVMSSDVPADRIAIMRQAFDDTMKDPGFLALMQKEQLSVYPLTGQQGDQIVSKITTVSPAIVAEAKKIYE